MSDEDSASVEFTGALLDFDPLVQVLREIHATLRAIERALSRQ